MVTVGMLAHEYQREQVVFLYGKKEEPKNNTNNKRNILVDEDLLNQRT